MKDKRSLITSGMGFIGSNLARRLVELGARMRELPWIRLTVVRFGIVALFGEGFYFILYGLLLFLTNNTAATLVITGGICILVNAYMHSRITFRVQFSGRLLLGYLQIQFIGFGVSFISGLVLDNAGVGKWLIALITYALWTVISFTLTMILYRAERPSFAISAISDWLWKLTKSGLQR
jgi:hypothetical protein